MPGSATSLEASMKDHTLVVLAVQALGRHMCTEISSLTLEAHCGVYLGTLQAEALPKECQSIAIHGSFNSKLDVNQTVRLDRTCPGGQTPI